MTLKKGTRFHHKRWLDPSSYEGHHKPLLCLVTAVRKGLVYYRPDYGLHDDGTPWLGSPGYFLAEDASKYAEPIPD